jgi:S-methylmethionine-dependent homocysteine/selenocysteine methylase
MAAHSIGGTSQILRRTRVLDGATGTELERRGVSCALPLWSARALLEAPEVVRAVHRDYALAGAEALTANTFRTQARSLAHAGIAHRAPELTALAVRLAREGAQEAGCAHAFVFGSAPPLEDCYQPALVPGDEALAREHEAHARNLAAAGVDAVLVETMNTAREGEAALRAAREAGLPALVSFVCGGEARLLSGEPLAAALARVAPLLPLAVGVNCAPWSDLAACLPVLRASGMPFFAYANLGAPASVAARPRDATRAEFAAAARAWIDSGAVWIGGCCDTTPAHVAALAVA